MGWNTCGGCDFESACFFEIDYEPTKWPKFPEFDVDSYLVDNLTDCRQWVGANPMCEQIHVATLIRLEREAE